MASTVSLSKNLSGCYSFSIEDVERIYKFAADNFGEGASISVYLNDDKEIVSSSFEDIRNESSLVISKVTGFKVSGYKRDSSLNIHIRRQTYSPRTITINASKAEATALYSEAENIIAASKIWYGFINITGTNLSYFLVMVSILTGLLQWALILNQDLAAAYPKLKYLTLCVVLMFIPPLSQLLCPRVSFSFGRQSRAKKPLLWFIGVVFTIFLGIFGNAIYAAISG